MPEIAASVSTLVVSWKDAAARKLSVFNEALVTPEQHRQGRGRLATLGQHLAVLVLELEAVDQLARQQLGVARLVDPQLAQHLARNHFDVLVVDADAL